MPVPYNINPFFTNTTSDELDYYLRSIVDDSNLTPTQTENVVNFDLDATFKHLHGIFSKMYYEVMPDESRNKILEYCLTLYSGKVRNVFTNFVPLDFPVENRTSAIKYLTFHTIIYLAEKRQKRIVELLDEIRSVFDVTTFNNLAKGYVQPINSFSDLSNIAQLRVKIDECLLRIKHEGISEPNLTTLLVFLILLETCDPFL